MARRNAVEVAVVLDRHNRSCRQNWSRSTHSACAEGQCQTMRKVCPPAEPVRTWWGHPRALSDWAQPESRVPLIWCRRRR
jgi:hypothetical protein